MSDLKRRLEELGLSQYYEIFVSEGFDTWETVLDITESDLNALNVKLGHRRKLQRAIHESRRTSYKSDDSANENKSLKRAEPSAQPIPGVASKRKYRRHPKTDENAPERPPSAYVIFSIQMREELKAEALSFTEIAKVVGERWQVLSPETRETYERQANTAKEKYYSELAEYKKTPQYAEYQSYLKEFKAKHGTSNDGKRPKLETETSTSTRSSSHEQSEKPRHIQEGFSASHRRSGSSPPHPTQGRTSRPLPQAISPVYSYANSPHMSERYSPIATSPPASHLMRDNAYDYPHQTTHTIPEYGSNSSHATSLQPFQSLVSPSPIPGYGQPSYPSTRDLPTRPTLREMSSTSSSSKPPPLVREDTTLSSATLSSAGGDSHSSMSRHGSLLPPMDPSKAQRVLPQPVPTVTTSPSPFDARTPAPAPIQDAHSSASPLAALLRAGELARDADNITPDHDARDSREPPPS